ncbi:MAG: hypothetical protein E7003_06845 [Eggerthellaceae bacterium]|nr:hypothetical protein [Eggerthellaceae bacterium]
MSKFKLRGLYTGDNEKIFNFCKLVDEKARSMGKAFFVADCEGHGAQIGEYCADDRSGWLVPIGEADDFERKWEMFQEDRTWPDASGYFVWEEWSQDDNGDIIIRFAKY